MACPQESWWPTWLMSPFIPKHSPEWILNNKVTLLVVIISFNPYKEPQSGSYYPILQMKKLSLDRLSTCAYGHAVSKWYSLELKPICFAPNPHFYLMLILRTWPFPFLLLFSVGWTAREGYPGASTDHSYHSTGHPSFAVIAKIASQPFGWDQVQW